MLVLLPCCALVYWLAGMLCPVCYYFTILLHLLCFPAGISFMVRPFVLIWDTIWGVWTAFFVLRVTTRTFYILKMHFKLI